MQVEVSATASAWSLADDASFTFAQSGVTIGEAPVGEADPGISDGYEPVDGSWAGVGQALLLADASGPGPAVVAEESDPSPFGPGADIPFL